MLRHWTVRFVAATAIVATGAIGWNGELAAADGFDAANATYEFDGEKFTLADGTAKIMVPSAVPDSPMPVGYDLARSASGSLGGADGAVVALYRGFGANLRWVVLFAFTENDGAYTQTAAGPAYESDSSVASLSVDDGTVSLDLLVVSDADRELPHVAQKPTRPLTLKFAIGDGKFVKAE